MKILPFPLILILLGTFSCKSSRSGSAEPPLIETGTKDSNPGTSPETVDPKEEWEHEVTPNPTTPESTIIPATDKTTDANALTLGRELKPSEAIQSGDGRFKLIFQTDSNLVIYYKGRALWASQTNGRDGNRVVMGQDGNLVMLNAANAVIWSSGTQGRNAQFARLNNEGSFNIYDGQKQILWTSGTCCYPPAKPLESRASLIGKWSEKGDWPLIPLHALLLPTGKIFTFGTLASGEQGAGFIYDIWNPALGFQANAHQTLPNTQATDIFCSAPLLAASSGNVVIPGGDTRNPKNRGIKDTLILDSQNQTLGRGPYLANARWYETATALPNGEILVYGGIDGDGRIVTVPEIYNPTSNRWRSLMGAVNTEVMNGEESKWWYPRQWIAPNGKIFGMTGEAMYWMTTSGSGSLQKIGKLPDRSRSYISSAVMYQPGKILQVGGSVRGNIGSRASDGAITVDINAGNPVVTPQNPMAYDRAWVSATVLPNGEVLTTGGSAFENQLQEPGFVAEMWNPDSRSFRPLAKTTIARLYHSTSLLLQDGSVLIGGGGAPGPLNNLNAEIFYPPYLFDAGDKFAKRPVITSAPATVAYGSAAEIQVSGGPIKKVSFIKLGAVTHSNDMEQRFIPLGFTTSGQTLRVQFPADANLAPPGYYHLFVLSAQGVPSVSKIVAMGRTPPPAM